MPPENLQRNDTKVKKEKKKPSEGGSQCGGRTQRLLYTVPAAAHKLHFVLQYFKSNNIPHE